MKRDHVFCSHNGFSECIEKKDGTQWIFEFENGYGASVITGGIAYGGKAGFFELAVLRGNELCYDTPITDDVVGWLTSDEVNQLLDNIEHLQGS